jgi:predicted Rossmann fold flavoprotein
MTSIAIIGAGPAGLIAAISAAETARNQGIQSSIVVFEKNSNPGRKLLITGSGQCNLTNNSNELLVGSKNNFKNPDQFLSHYGSRGQARFLKNAFYPFTNRDTICFFQDLGVPVTVRDDGKVFPASFRAADILSALLHRCAELEVDISCSSPVSRIEQHTNGFSLQIRESEMKSFQKVIISVGGYTYPSTGSTGDGYLFAKDLGHTVVIPKPALSGITVSHHKLSSLAGISFENIDMTLWRTGKKILSVAGDMLITHTGFSGPVVVNNSRSMQSGDELVFDFSQQGEHFLKEMQKQTQQNGISQISTIVQKCGIPKRLSDKILEIHHIDGRKKCAEITKKDLRAINEAGTAWKQVIASAGKVTNAMVTAGGISIKEIHSGTMGSRIIPSLFFAGEVLDIDGETGGYNLQAAFSTGILAGKSAVI